MIPKKFRWSRVYESSEEELQNFLESRGIQAERTHLDMGDDSGELHAAETMTIWCAEGLLAINISDTTVSLQPGDALEIAEGTIYELRPGIGDCAFYTST
jgi:hypothetical protein